MPKSAWSAAEIVVVVVPWPTETVCSRLVVAMCMCTRRVRWAAMIPSRMTNNIRGWSGGGHRKRLLKSRAGLSGVHYNVVEAWSGSKSEW